MTTKKTIARFGPFEVQKTNQAYTNTYLVDTRTGRNMCSTSVNTKDSQKWASKKIVAKLKTIDARIQALFKDIQRLERVTLHWEEAQRCVALGETIDNKEIQWTLPSEPTNPPTT